MPFYNFECTNEKCLHQFEELFLTIASYEEAIPIKCPTCGAEATHILNLIQDDPTTGMLFKGLPMGNGVSAGIQNLRKRYPKGR